MATEQQDVVAVLEQFEKDLLYIESHWDELLDQHLGRWIVVYGEELVGEGATLPDALDEARPKCAIGNAAVEFITHEPRNMLL